jgi:hypothetical protein
VRAAAEYIAARIPGARLYGVEGKGAQPRAVSELKESGRGFPLFGEL